MFWKNTEKYITFSVQINKEIIKTDEDGNDKTVNIACKLKFTDSFRFISTSLSSLVDNLSDKFHDLYVQSDTLLLADIFENFRNKCIETYKLDPSYFLLAPGLTWQGCLKKREIELE